MADTEADIIVPSLAHKWDDKKRTDDVEIDNNISFAKMMLSDNVFKGLEANGFVAPSPIQLRAIPLGRCNLDLLVQAKAGTGKTLVFVTIILEKFSSDIHAPQSLVIVPTREIAVQIESVFMAIGSYTKGFKVGCFIGGMDITEDRQKIQHCRSIIGTPGRILHLINNKILNINEIKTFVLDEADQLVGKSFETDVIRIWETLPQRVQSLALSATFSNDLDKKLLKFMSPNHICVSPKREPAILRGVQQFIYNNSNNNENVNSMEMESIKNLTSAKLMLEKVLDILKIFQIVSFKQCLIFSNSQSRAESYCNYLRNNNWSADVIIGSQDQPTRLKIFKKFRTCQTRILCASDLMARGIDSENVNLVINLDIPVSSSVYLHRIGRCGRFGSEGIAITFIDNNWQLVKFRKLLGYIGGNKMTCYMYPKLFELNISLNDAIKDYNYVKQLQCITGLIEQNDPDAMNTQTADNELFANVLIKDKNIQESTNKNEQFISMLLKNNVENVDEKSDEIVDEKSDTNSDENFDEKSDENVDEANKNDTKTEEINQETLYQIAENLNLLNISKLLIDNNSQSTNENTTIKFNDNNLFESYRQYEFDSVQSDSELPQLYQGYLEEAHENCEQSHENLQQNYKIPKENQDDLQQYVKENMFDPQEIESKLLFLDTMKRYQLKPSASVLFQNEMIVKNDTSSQYVNESESVFKSSSSLSASMSIKLPKSSSSSSLSMSNDLRSQLSSSLSASVSIKLPSSSSSSSSSISNDSRSQLSSSLSRDENRAFVKNASCTNRINTQPNSFSSACINYNNNINLRNNRSNYNEHNNNNNNNNIINNSNNNSNNNSININNSKINNNNNNNENNNKEFRQSFEDSNEYTNYHQVAYCKWYQQYWNQIAAITNAANYSKYVREFK